MMSATSGVAVSTEEVKQVFSQADGKGPKKLEDGVINEAELKVAVAVRSHVSAPDVSALRFLLLQVWYCSASEKASQKSSSMCTIL